MLNEYKVYYYVNSQNKKTSVEDYIERLTFKEQVKIFW